MLQSLGEVRSGSVVLSQVFLWDGRLFITWVGIQYKVLVSMKIQWRFKSVWGSTQSDQSLSFLPEETLDSWLPIERPSKTLIRLQMHRLIWVFHGANANLHSKTCVKRPLSKRPKIGFQDQLHNAGQKYCRMLQGSILQYFRPSLCYHLSLRSLFWSIFVWPFYTGFTVPFAWH